ncbi:hypothetical protein [Bacillus sp. SN10]|uniref:hypothetical protein n=2 Tax=Bacillus TaxID=1386 RepID=UPI000C34D5D5|nr:hypothetical protein [Bacillus sp. SN10]PKJ52673.1 hypothetical protein CWE34_26495 [Bacillus sp. SN10]
MKELKTSSKVWRNMREDLIERIGKSGLEKPDLTIINGTPYDVSLDGGRLGYIYSFNTRDLRVWGKASRNSRRAMTVNELRRLQDLVREWHLDWEILLDGEQHAS